MPSATAASTAEVWRHSHIPGFEVSSHGRVRGRAGEILAGFLDADGYPRVSYHENGKTKQVAVHTLVCTAFHGIRPSPAHTVAHGDGERANNKASNLRWATPKEQYADRRRHGTEAKSGERNWNAKISNAQAAAIRAAYRPGRGAGYPALAKAFGVSKFTVYRVVKLGAFA